MAMKGKNFPEVAASAQSVATVFQEPLLPHLEAAFLPASLNHTMHSSSLFSAIEHPYPILLPPECLSGKELLRSLIDLA